MRKAVISVSLMMALAIGVAAYAAIQPQPAHCGRTAAARAARAAKQNGGAHIVPAVAHGHHHHHGATGDVNLMQNVIDPIPSCFPCDSEPVTCECGFWVRFWHCGFSMH
jgi:hypothetical protein